MTGPTENPGAESGHETGGDALPSTTETPAQPHADLMPDGDAHLDYAAISDVGRVRKNNQDSGYAGPWLLAVCDGVGGAARGDIASSTALGQLRALDVRPSNDDVLGHVAQALGLAHDDIGRIVDQDPSLAGTSTTAVLGLFDGRSLAIGHIGDSRAYLLRDGAITRLTSDHTFVQGLVDEGRITDEDARHHPHRNLILRALDGRHEPDPDLFIVPLATGDRLMLCSDGVCGSMDDDLIASILADGTPDFAAVELVRLSLEHGSTDNVTCVVADVVAGPAVHAQVPQLVGSAAELAQPQRRVTLPHVRLRPHRPGDGKQRDDAPELPELSFAIKDDPIDDEHARYAAQEPRRRAWIKRLLVAAIVIGVGWIGAVYAWSWSQDQYYVAEYDGHIAIYQGINANVPVIDLHSVQEVSDVAVDDLSDLDAGVVRQGITASSLADAQATVERYAALAQATQGSKDQPGKRDRNTSKDGDAMRRGDPATNTRGVTTT